MCVYFPLVCKAFCPLLSPCDSVPLPPSRSQIVSQTKVTKPLVLSSGEVAEKSTITVGPSSGVGEGSGGVGVSVERQGRDKERSLRGWRTHGEGARDGPWVGNSKPQALERFPPAMEYSDCMQRTQAKSACRSGRQGL